MKKSRLFIGLMSGTSVDAIDAALVSISGGRQKKRYELRVLSHIEHPWPKKLRQRLLNIMAPAPTSTTELCELNFLVAQEFAKAVEICLASKKIARNAITAIGSHGQTICHLPPMKRPQKFVPSTLQIGDPSVIATLCDITTVGNFRTADMALGGQGAPLVPWTDGIMLADPKLSRCVQNIGGIANVSYLPALDHKPAKKWTFFTPLSVSTQIISARSQILAFDTGPGNMLMDAVLSLSTKGKQRYDRNGQLAQRGQLDEKLLRKLKSHPYFAKHPPKSTGREDFGEKFASNLLIENRKSKIENLLHTLARLTAWSIADAYRRFLPRMPDELILCGGGADNPTLIKMLAEELGPTIKLRRIDEFGIPNKAKEAASFALLAAAALDGIPANLPSVTGASRPVILGVIAKPF